MKTFDHMAIQKPAILSKCPSISYFNVGVRKWTETSSLHILKAPTITDLDSFGENSGRPRSPIPLQIYVHELEKKFRDSRMPYVMFDPVNFPFVKFHVQFVRQFLLDRKKVPQGTKEYDKLLLDTRNGHPLTSASISNALKVWIYRYIDSELNISAMDLRAAFATHQIRRHANRRSLPEEQWNELEKLTEGDFLTILACIMNNGKEELREICAAWSHAEFATSTAQNLGICQDNGNQGNN